MTTRTKTRPSWGSGWMEVMSDRCGTAAAIESKTCCGLQSYAVLMVDSRQLTVLCRGRAPVELHAGRGGPPDRTAGVEPGDPATRTRARCEAVRAQLARGRPDASGRGPAPRGPAHAAGAGGHRRRGSQLCRAGHRTGPARRLAVHGGAAPGPACRLSSRVSGGRRGGERAGLRRDAGRCPGRHAGRRHGGAARARPDDGPGGQPFITEPYDLAVAESHALAQRKAVRLSELAEEPSSCTGRGRRTRRDPARLCGRRVPTAHRPRDRRDERRAGFVAAGLGITVLPRSSLASAGPAVRILSLRPVFSAPRSWSGPRKARARRPARSFLEFARDHEELSH